MINYHIQHPKEHCAVGRPSAILFDYEWMQDRFDHIATTLTDQYFDTTSGNTKKQFVLPSERMGKTSFWALIYIISRRHNLICSIPTNHNLELFVDHLIALLGHDKVGKRPAITKCVILFIERHADTTFPLTDFKPADQEYFAKHRAIFQHVEQLVLNILSPPHQ